MITLKVSTNATEVSRAIQSFFRDQIPFATSVAINGTAKDIQKAQREGMRRRFTIRRPWVLQGVRISKFSTKRDLEAIVEIDPKRDFLFKFEEGGILRPRGSRLAIPRDARRGKTGVVSRAQRPRSFDFVKTGDGPKGETFEGKKRTFMIKKPGGRGAIFQRVGGKGSTRRKLLFIFAPTARIEASLEFEQTAQTVFDRTFSKNFETAFDKAVRTAR